MKITKNQILDRLANHKPIEAPAAKRRVWMSWVVTVGLILMLPLGISLAGMSRFSDHMVLAISLAVVGALGIVIACLAAFRKSPADNQWGLAPLTAQECQELQELSECDYQIQQIVDHWLDVWVSSGKSPRGRDLALLRQMTQYWNDMGDAEENSVPSAAWAREPSPKRTKATS
jgi:hypothetical protein